MNLHHQALIDAIKNRNILTFTYRGHPRVVEPHAYGVTTAGNDALRCFQTAGTSRKNKVPDWKLMTVREISNLSVETTTFASARHGYNHDDKGMPHIYVQL